MKRNLLKRIMMVLMCGMIAFSAFGVTTFADESSSEALDGLDKVVVPVVKLLNSLMGPLLAIVGAAGSLYCILLGVKYAKAEEPQDREKAKSHLKNAIIGFVLIFILILALNLLMDPLINWVNQNAGSMIIK